jgi:hypothetical protein
MDASLGDVRVTFVNQLSQVGDFLFLFGEHLDSGTYNVVA